MSSPRQNANERRLAKVRVLKEEHFKDDLTDAEIIAAKNARIELLEDEVAKLRKRVNKLEERLRNAKTPPTPRQPRQRTTPESGAADQPRFDFYRS